MCSSDPSWTESGRLVLSKQEVPSEWPSAASLIQMRLLFGYLVSALGGTLVIRGGKPGAGSRWVSPWAALGSAAWRRGRDDQIGPMSWRLQPTKGRKQNLGTLSSQMPTQPLNGRVNFIRSLLVSVSHGLPWTACLVISWRGIWGGGVICDTCHQVCSEAPQPLPFFVRQASLGAWNWVGTVCSPNTFIFSHHCLHFHWENKYYMLLLPAIFS